MDDARPNANARGYDWTWRTVTRPTQLRRAPYCELCAERGLVQRANTVDHRRARRLFPLHLQRSTEPGGADHGDNLRSLCGPCHSQRADDKSRRGASHG